MTEIYLHIVARMADYIATHPYRSLLAALWADVDATAAAATAAAQQASGRRSRRLRLNTLLSVIEAGRIANQL